MKNKAKKLIIHGIVQGVFYRKTIFKNVRDKLPQLKGHVKNLANGCVEVIAQGSEAQLSELMDLCYTGSSSSKVEHIEFSEIEIVEGLVEFHIAD